MLAELAWAFLKLGVTAFGGPAAHIAMMENEFVRRRKWLPHERFLDLLGAANLIPGPSSSELAIYIGYERAGWLGLLVAGAAFVLPAALMVTAIAWAYVQFGSLPQLGGILYGVKPVVIAVVVQALWGLAPKAVSSRWMGALAVLSGIALVCGVETLAVLVGAGALSLAVHRARTHRAGNGAGLAFFAPVLAWGGGTSFSFLALFLTFVKMGAVVFGSGYVLLAFLRADFVDRLHWLTEAQLLDAVAVGQITPGPVFTTATFIGYVIAGPAGAAVSTVGIFLPGFVLVAATRPILERMRRAAGAGAFLDGVNAATLALMAVVTVQLARSALVDAVTATLAGVGAVLLVRFKVNTTWLVLGGALAGVAVRTLG